jgi:hypothetical protein
MVARITHATIRRGRESLDDRCEDTKQSSSIKPMTLKQFKEHVESIEPDTVFDYAISIPFVWRGAYQEVAFSVSKAPMTREEVLRRIKTAIGGTFYARKGNEMKYYEWTTVNFEEDYNEASGGDYTGQWISAIEDRPVVRSQEERLTNLIFPKHHADPL